MQAFTWGWFDDGTTFVNGLWNDSTTLGGDFATIVYRAQLLGFNAVRLPFRFSELNMQPKNWTFPCTPQRYADIKVNVKVNLHMSCFRTSTVVLSAVHLQ